MTHKTIVATCQAAGLTVKQVPASDRRNYQAHNAAGHLRVYWSTSYEGGRIGLPRVIQSSGHDTHARTAKEITYLLKD